MINQNILRSSIGFEDNDLGALGDMPSYPPHNIERHGHGHYRIVVALAGFDQRDIQLTQQRNTLMIKGHVREKDTPIHYQYKGIAERSFEKTFQIAHDIYVERAFFQKGLLVIVLKRAVVSDDNIHIIPLNTPPSLTDNRPKKSLTCKRTSL